MERISVRQRIKDVKRVLLATALSVGTLSGSVNVAAAGGAEGSLPSQKGLVCSFDPECPAELPYCNIIYPSSGENFGVCSDTEIHVTQVIDGEECPAGTTRRQIYPNEGSEAVCLPH